MRPILSYQNIATLTPVYLQGNWTLNNSVRFVKTMTNIINLENLAIYIGQTHTRDYALVRDYIRHE